MIELSMFPSIPYTIIYPLLFKWFFVPKVLLTTTALARLRLRTSVVRCILCLRGGLETRPPLKREKTRCYLDSLIVGFVACSGGIVLFVKNIVECCIKMLNVVPLRCHLSPHAWDRCALPSEGSLNSLRP